MLSADYCLERFEFRWIVGGLLDEPAHLATSMLFLANLPPSEGVWLWGYAAGSVAVDVDHLPLVRVRASLLKSTRRPAAHTLVTPAALAGASSLARGPVRAALRGAAAGVAAHFVRDIATGSGLAPLQPLLRWRLRLPRRLYSVAMVLLATRPLRESPAGARATVLYDADCGFCNWSLRLILAWDRRGRLRPVALQDPEADELLQGMDEQAKMASGHLVTPHGRLLSGGAAAPELLRLLPGGRPLATLLAALPRATERAYRWVVRHRAFLGSTLRLRAEPPAR